jgi:hypothetical protein
MILKKNIFLIKMCHNFSVSFLTGLWSYAVCFYLWKRHRKLDHWNAIFLFSFSTIQFLDAILWTQNPGKECTLINLITTSIFIPLILASQSLASIYGANTYIKVPKIAWIISIVGTIYVLIIHFPFDLICSTLSPEKYLLWFDKDTSWWKRMTSFLLLIYPFHLWYVNRFIYYILLVITLMAFVYASYLTDSFGSNWCWICNLASIPMLIPKFKLLILELNHYDFK